MMFCPLPELTQAPPELFDSMNQGENRGVPAETTLDYPSLIRQALLDVVRSLLQRVERSGLPGKHHFYLTFRTTHPGVRLSDSLRKQYPEMMTIVLQHQFEGLQVKDESFSVMLRFGGVRTPLHIPFEALTSFADPSAGFALPLQLIVANEAEAETIDDAVEAAEDSSDGVDGGNREVLATAADEGSDDDEKAASNVVAFRPRARRA